QIISAILCYLRMLKMKDVLTLDIHAFKLDGKLSKQLIRLGLPVGITQALFAVAAIFVQNLTNTFGTVFIAASTVVMRVDGFAMLPNFTFGTAMTTYAGQNVGAMKIGRMRQGTKEGLKIGVTTSVVLVGLILIFGKHLMGLFTNTDEVINVSYEMMCILSVGYIGVAINQILSGTIRGAGDTMTPMWIALVTTTLIRLPIAYGMAYLTRSEALPKGEPRSIYYSLVFAWVLGAIITAIVYKIGRWAKRARIGGKIMDISKMD
ncbi:MAG: MATE family efflux transporter, partial [Catonella sp.]